MALLPLTLIFVFVSWALAFMLMDRQRVSRMTSAGIFTITIPMLSPPLEYVTENGGTLASVTLSLSSTTIGYLVLFNVFFLIISLVNFYDYLSQSGTDWRGRKRRT